MTRARLSKEELELIEDALIYYGVSNLDLRVVISTIIRKIKVTKGQSPYETIMMEPYK